LRLALGFISRFRVGDANNISIIPYSYENDSAYLLEYVYSAMAVLKRKQYLGVYIVQILDYILKIINLSSSKLTRKLPKRVEIWAQVGFIKTVSSTHDIT